jgi:hypothetical protein
MLSHHVIIPCILLDMGGACTELLASFSKSKCVIRFSYKFRPTLFARSNSGIVGSNPIQGMDVCIYVYSVFILSCM